MAQVRDVAEWVRMNLFDEEQRVPIVADLDGDSRTDEIVVTPKEGDLWMATYGGDAREQNNWIAEPLPTPGSNTRKKMDNVYLAGMDGDGDTDVMTTEENGGWGVIWFENPTKKPSHQ